MKTGKWLGTALLSLLGLIASSAQAVPSYARQTGAECAACHIGGFGPQLTPYGMAFKLGGYTDTDGKSGKVPLSAMAVGTWTHTAQGQDPAPEHFKSNNNGALQEASLFLAGRLGDHVGTFIQSTYSGVDRKSALDNVDIRYARSMQLGGKDAVVGLSLNNNPTITDPFNTLAGWRFPFMASDLGFGEPVAPKVEGLAQSVIGVNAYTLWDKSFYGEIGVYNSLSKTGLNMINADDAGKFKGVGTYWRLAYFKDMKRDNFSVGLFGFNAGIQPDRGDLGTADKFRDVGVDASYQFLGNRRHVFTVNASAVREWQKLNYTYGTLAAADNLKNTLDQYKVAASYHYNQTWGGTVALFDTRGSTDSTLYGNSTGRPNTSGYILQADWTPWGKESSWAAPWANLRLGAQYTGYTRFNGASHDYDGSGRNARDNNTVFLFAWIAI